MNLHRVSPSNIFDKKLKMDSLKFFRQKILEHHLVPKVLTQIIKRSFLATILSDKFCCLNFFLHKRISTHYYYFNNKQHGKLVYYKLASFNVSLF